MQRIFSLLLSIHILIVSAIAQNVGIGTITPVSSAKLDITSTNSGFLPPRMNFAQRNAIVNPVAGLIIYCIDCGGNGEWQGYNGVNWMNMTFGIGSNTAVNLPSFTTTCNQTWTTQNLSVSRYRNGEMIQQVTDINAWANLTTGAWCWYNNDSATYWQYGKLYNWYAVNDPRGLGPQGWHVPTDAEWNQLVKCIDPSADTLCQNCSQSATAGGAIKEAGISHWLSPNTGATNSSGFAALPSGYRGYDGSFYYVSNLGFFWSSTENFSNAAWFRYLDYFSTDIYKGNNVKSNGYSIRLVKDN